MNQSENISELAQALSKAQGEMQAAIKDKVNPFFKSKYADLGSVWDAARPVLSKHGLCVIQATELMGEKIVLVTTLAHSSGQWIKSYLPLLLTKLDSQGIGAALTYLRRYGLSAIVGVVCDDDDDGNSCSSTTTQKKSEKISSIPSLEETQKSEKITSITSPEVPNKSQCASRIMITNDQMNIILSLIKKVDNETRSNIESWMLKNNIPQNMFDLLTEKQAESVIMGMQNNIKMQEDKEPVS